MSRQILRTEDAPPTWAKFPVSQGIATDSLVFVGGMAYDEVKGERMAEATSLAEETRIVLRTIDRILNEAGCSLADVVTTTCYITDNSYRKEVSDAYAEFWDEGNYPVRCTFVVGIGSDCRVEIQAIAVRPSAK